VAAAVILPAAGAPPGAADSKALSAAHRARLEPLIKASCFWAIGEASANEIDALNILKATHLAMRRAVDALALPPDLALVDGDRAPALACAVRTIIGGDASEPAIACASILAKEHRDRLMRAAEEAFPGYGFASHKGYGAAAHAAALSRLGPCALHRMSFKPVAAAARRFAAGFDSQA
jgi:ribonuclease HII